MGLLGVADATTLAGEFTVAPSPGLEIVIGNPDEGGGGGTCAGGAGSELVLGDHVGGVGVGVGAGVGVGDGAEDGGCGGVGLGFSGGATLAVVAVPPHPASVSDISRAQTKKEIEYAKEREERNTMMNSNT